MDTLRYTPSQIANTFLEQYGAEGNLTHMKLQKLVYLTHGYWLQTHDDPMLSTDPEVWQYGPVFSGLYQHFRNFRSDVIKQPVPELFDDEASTVDTHEALHVIGAVWKKYGRKSGGYLSDLTHKKGSPWQIMAERHGFRVPKGLKIPTDLIRDYYRAEVPRLA